MTDDPARWVPSPWMDGWLAEETATEAIDYPKPALTPEWPVEQNVETDLDVDALIQLWGEDTSEHPIFAQVLAEWEQQKTTEVEAKARFRKEAA